MLFRKIIFIGMLAGIPLMVLSCGNDQNDSRYDGMMENGHMRSGSMMGEQQRMMNDSTNSGQQRMMEYGSEQSNSRNVQQPLTLNQVRKHAEEYLQNTGMTSMKIGEGINRGNEYEFPLIRKSDGSRVASLLVNQSTGEVRSQR